MSNESEPGTPTKPRISRPIPINSLDFDLMTTNTEWGGQNIPQDLRNKLTKLYLQKKANEEKMEITTEDLWSLLGFYTRDMRLGNLSSLNGEFQYCQYYLDLANDFLRAEFIEPFLITLSRVATILELSQSKGGFFRRRMNTFTQEHFQTELEPKKRNLFGMAKKEE